MSEDVHPPMEVRRLQLPDGSCIEPALEQGWSKLEKLRWKAGVVLADSGVSASITTNCYSRRFLGRDWFDPNVYGVAIGSATLVGLDFDGVWDYLNGVSDGATAVGGSR